MNNRNLFTNGQPAGPPVPLIGTGSDCGGPMALLATRCLACSVDYALVGPDGAAAIDSLMADIRSLYPGEVPG